MDRFLLNANHIAAAAVAVAPVNDDDVLLVTADQRAARQYLCAPDVAVAVLGQCVPHIHIVLLLAPAGVGR